MYGVEDYLINWAANSIIDKYVNPSVRALDYAKLDEEGLTAQDVIEASETFTMMSEKRVVWFKEPVNFSKYECERLSSYVERPNEGSILIISNNNFTNDVKNKNEKRSDLDKLLLEKATCYNFCPLDKKTLIGFIDKRFKLNNAEISQDLLLYMIDETGYFNKESDYRITNLENDILKIVAHSQGRPITRKDIDESISGDIATFVFDFLDAVTSNRKDMAFLLLHNILSSGNDIYSVLAILISQFELILEIKEYREDGGNSLSISKELGVHEFRVKKGLSFADKFETKKIKEILSSLYEVDRNIKTGNMSGDVALELILGKI